MTKLLQQALDALIESRDDVSTCLAENQKLAGYSRYDRRIAFYEAQLVKHDAAIEALKNALAQQEHFEEQPDGTVIPVDPSEMAQQESDHWKDAVIDQLVVHHIYQAVHDTEPRKAIYDLLCMNQSIALDPQVSSDAQALIDRGRREAEKEQPAQDPVATVAEVHMNRLTNEQLCKIWIEARQKKPADPQDPLSMNSNFIACLAEFLEIAQQEQPTAARPVGFDYLDSGQLVATYALPVGDKNHPKLYTAPPTQPALSAELKAAVERTRFDLLPGGSNYPDVRVLLAFAEVAIEAHCRGEKS